MAIQEGGPTSEASPEKRIKEGRMSKEGKQELEG